MKKIIIAILMLFATALIIGCTTETQTEYAQIKTEAATAANNAGDYEIQLSELSSELKKYTYNANGVEVKFFALKDADGEIRTAFDACDICGGYKGYRQEGNDAVCNNCGRHFSLQDIGTKNKGGGCWPSYLEHTIEGDKVLVSKEEIAAGAFRFA